VEKSLKAHSFVESDDQQDFEHLVQPEIRQGEGFGTASLDMDVRR